MLNHRSAGKRASLRESLWADSGGKIWPPQKNANGDREGGWAKMPRTISAIARVFAENSKGIDLLPTYIDLLARTPEEGIVEIGNEDEHAAMSGFSANARGVKSWRTRIRALHDLGFIKAFAAARPVDQVIVVHPTLAMQQLHVKGGVSDAVWAQFKKILIDVGASPVTDSTQPPSDTAAPA